MIGFSKLSDIRNGLRHALDSTGEDPIQWLEERMAHKRTSARTERTEILESLQRFLKSPGKAKSPAKRGRKQRLSAKS